MLARNVIKIKMKNVAGQMIFEYEREFEESHQKIKKL